MSYFSGLSQLGNSMSKRLVTCAAVLAQGSNLTRPSNAIEAKILKEENERYRNTS